MKNSVLNFLGKDSGFGDNNTSAYLVIVVLIFVFK